MLNSGKIFRDKKNKYSNSRVVRKKNSENEVLRFKLWNRFSTKDIDNTVNLFK